VRSDLLFWQREVYEKISLRPPTSTFGLDYRGEKDKDLTSPTIDPPGEAKTKEKGQKESREKARKAEASSIAKRETDPSGHPTGHQRTQKALTFVLPTIFVATAQGNATSLITAQSIVRMDGYVMQPQTSIRHNPVQMLDSLLRLVPPVQRRSSPT
jgi:hypothetical protein